VRHDPRTQFDAVSRTRLAKLLAFRAHDRDQMKTAFQRAREPSKLSTRKRRKPALQAVKRIDRTDMSRVFQRTGDGLGISALVTSGWRTPVLLIHGNSSSGNIFSHQIAELKRMGHPAIAPDLPGHGRSDNARDPESTYSFPGYAAALRGLLQSLNVSRYHVLGWSLGGHIGIEMWYADPGALSLLVTGTPPVSLSPAGAARAFNVTPVMNLAGLENFGLEEVKAYGSAMLGEPLDGRSQLARTIKRTDGKARHWMMKNGLAGVGIDQVSAVADCDRPLAIVQGNRDPFVNIPYIQGLKYTNLWLNKPILIESGHAPHFQEPKLFNSYLRDFLQHVG
jgi:pimeloyl-ACP methyl ester carboxylesterase